MGYTASAEHPEEARENMKCKTKLTKMWAWWSEEAQVFCHVYPRRAVVKMCSADGFKASTKRGEGKIVPVIVKEMKK